MKWIIEKLDPKIDVGNDLIRKYMGLRWEADRDYHKDWNKLIPVIRKLKDYLQHMPDRPSRNHCCKGDLIEVDLQCQLWELNIEKVWEHTIQLIEWYNKRQLKTDTDGNKS